MARLVALLGSINTGGNRLKMADLRGLLTARGLANVATVTASGNVLFDGDIDQSESYRELIVASLSDEFGIETFAVLKSRDDLVQAIEENPFKDSGEDNFVHVHFLETQPSEAAFAKLDEDHAGRGAERFAPGKGSLHIDYVDGVGRSKLTGHFIAKRLDCRGTARNIRSLRRIAEAMEQEEY